MSAPLRRPRGPRAGFLRISGLFVMTMLVVSGFGIGALYYSVKEPRVRKDLQRQLDQAPTTDEGRLERWVEFYAAQVHHRLSVYARISEEHPWLVTHLVESGGEEPPAVWGLDVSDLSKDLLHREGMSAVLTLDAPRLLGHVRFGGDSVRHAPRYAPGTPVPDPRTRLEELAVWFLEGLMGALERDIPGAGFEVRIRS